jgi:hypothetical protein
VPDSVFTRVVAIVQAIVVVVVVAAAAAAAVVAVADRGLRLYRS